MKQKKNPFGPSVGVQAVCKKPWAPVSVVGDLNAALAEKPLRPRPAGGQGSTTVTHQMQQFSSLHFRMATDAMLLDYCMGDPASSSSQLLF